MSPLPSPAATPSHAAYLSRELARAEHALRSGARYEQDAAPGNPASAGHPVIRGESYVTLPYRLAGLSPAGA
jgi:hypothetical protein